MRLIGLAVILAVSLVLAPLAVEAQQAGQPLECSPFRLLTLGT
jgi:hypothetical protein